MQKDKLKELVKKYIEEMSASAGAGGFLGQTMVKKPQKESTTKAFTRNPARPVTNQDKNSPTGFEKMPQSGKVYTKIGFKVIHPDDRLNSKDLWKESINEVRYSQFKNETRTRTPQQQLHEGIKKIQHTLDEVNKLVEFATRMKTELKGDAEQMNYLKRTHNSLIKINEKIQLINEKIKDLTE